MTPLIFRPWRRRQLPPELEVPYAGFQAVLGELEPAKAVLPSAMPTTRLPGRPLPDVLLEFETRLGAAAKLMPGWRTSDVETSWTACAAGIEEALGRARRLREEAPDLGGFEGLVWIVGDLLAPLEPFEAAAARFAELKRQAPLTDPVRRSR